MNTSSDHNPYQPPTADVTPPIDEDEGWVSGGRAVPVGNAATWIGQGWALFVKSPGVWILNVIIVFVLCAIAASIPLLGGLTSNLLMPVIFAGILLGCRSLDNDGGLRVEHVFAGFKENVGQLILVGLLLFAATIAILVIVALAILVLFGGAIFHAMGNPQAMSAFATGHVLQILALAVLLAFAFFIPVSMAYWFAPALIVFHQLDAVTAMKQSFQGCLRNILPFLIYGLLMFLLFIAALIPFGLGLLILGPVVYGSIYASYRDIYLRQ